MQEDMHYYGTYALARAAGLNVKQANVIAYAAQYVDDSTANDSVVHADGGMFLTVATAHTNSEAIGNAIADHTEQRKVWIPFHFFPGNEGSSLSEKLRCVKDSDLVKEMVSNHIRHAVSVKDEYGLTLIGIMAHVYADTFAHYGFSGVSSRNNKVDGTSFELDVKDESTKLYIMGKFSSFLTKYAPKFLIKNFRDIVSSGAAFATGALGHGAVGTYPDRPFLRWRFNYKVDDKVIDSGWRDNRITFLEAAEKLHAVFSEYAKQTGVSTNSVSFDSIKETVKNIIALELPKEGRIKAWIDAIENEKLFTVERNDRNESNEQLHYSDKDWEQEKHLFDKLNESTDVSNMEVYHFHQAATYHRDYTLKTLLPKHGIVVL